MRFGVPRVVNEPPVGIKNSKMSWASPSLSQPWALARVQFHRLSANAFIIAASHTGNWKLRNSCRRESVSWVGRNHPVRRTNTNTQPRRTSCVGACCVVKCYYISFPFAISTGFHMADMSLAPGLTESRSIDIQMVLLNITYLSGLRSGSYLGLGLIPDFVSYAFTRVRVLSLLPQYPLSNGTFRS